MFSLEPDLSVTLTILIVVVTMNAINFIDGLDGLAAGIVAVAALSFLVYSYSLIKNIGSTSQSLPAVASALLAGMCVGFLPHNFYPARIFMGDIGAMLLGLLLAYGPISSTNQLDPALLIAYSHNPNHPLDRFPTFLPLLVPAAIFIIPYADLMFAILRRTKAGKPLMAADRQHMHHRLLNIGHSYRQSVLIMYLWAALFSVTVVSLSLVRTPSVVFIAATLVAVLALLPVTMPAPAPLASPDRRQAPARRQAPRASTPASAPPTRPRSTQPLPAPRSGGSPATTPAALRPTASAADVPRAMTPPSAHAAAASVPDVPRFLPAAPSPFSGQPVSRDRSAAPWEQVGSNHPAPWQDAYGGHDAAAPQPPSRPGPLSRTAPLSRARWPLRAGALYRGELVPGPAGSGGRGPRWPGPVLPGPAPGRVAPLARLLTFSLTFFGVPGLGPCLPVRHRTSLAICPAMRSFARPDPGVRVRTEPGSGA